MLKLVCFSLLFLGPGSALALDFDLNRLASDSSIKILSDKFQAREGLQITQEKAQIKGNRELLSVTFQHPRLGRTRILVSGPPGFRKNELPVLFVMAGFQTGLQSISFLQNPKDRIVVAYEYPVSSEELLAHPEQFAEYVQQSMGQAALLLVWLYEQQWVEHVDILGVSLGTLLLPASIRLSFTLGFLPKRTIFAFGGAEVGSMFRNYLAGKIPAGVIEPLAQLVDVSTLPLAPKIHIPYLKGSFLVIRGIHDQVFTRESGELQERLLPEPKKIVRLNTGHINPDTTDIIQQTVRVIEQFLKSN